MSKKMIMNLTTGTVISKDGTRISYRKSGTGPAIILLPGTLTMAKDFDTFSKELATQFTVYAVDRRGRGASGPQGNEYSISKEVEDVQAVQQLSGAQYLFGHSFGGFLALEAGRSDVRFKKVAVFEPGVCIDNSIPIEWTKLCREQLNKKKNLDAFVTFVRGINPEKSGKAPRFVLKAMLPLFIKKPERMQKYQLLPGTIIEHEEEVRLNNTYTNYREITADVLLMTGGEDNVTSVATKKLASVIPHTKMQQFSKMDHFGPEKHPKEVADILKQYMR